MLDITVRSGLPFPVVGVGASAADEQELQRFFAATPADSGMVYIVIQSQAADQQSLTAELVAAQTTMPVSMISDGTSLEPNHVYVMRPVR
jgi:two-component system, chemotaxis family, CheB/CheR fusion protein